jgi:hypothetical protein
MKKLLRSKKDKEQFMTWVAFLQAGVFKKATRALQTEEGHCCLGVACELTVGNLKIKYNDWMAGEFPTAQNAPRWVRDVNNDFKNKGGLSILSDLNDNGWSHKRIATKLLEVYAKEL